MENPESPSPIVLSEEPKKFDKKLIIVIVVIIFSVLIGYTIQSNFSSKETSLEENKQEIKDGWKIYKNTLLGIEFTYPESWGEPYTNPPHLTNLNSLAIEGDQKGEQISIGFKGSWNGPTLILFDNKTSGLEKVYSNNRFLDNLSQLRNTGDICIYFFSPYISYRKTHKEIYNSCDNGLKKNIIEIVEDFRSSSAFETNPGILYSYHLNYFTYAKAGNIYFPHVLAKFTPNSTFQLKASTTQQDIINNETYRRFKEINNLDFVEFAKSVKPISVEKYPRTKIQVNSSDPLNIKLVKNHFNLIAEGKYQEAYRLFLNPKQREFEFMMYLNKISDQVIKEVNLLANGNIEVFLDIQFHNQSPEKYRQLFRIENNKLGLILEEKINGEISTFGGKRTYASEREGQSIVVLQEGSQEKIIDSVKLPQTWQEEVSIRVFYSPTFSPKGTYIRYIIGYYEGSGSNVYDVLRDKVLNESLPDGNFNPQESLYFSCVFSEAYGPSEAKIYNIPDFTTKLDLLIFDQDLENYWDYDCSYDNNTNTETYVFSGKYGAEDYDKDARKVYSFDGQSGELIP